MYVWVCIFARSMFAHSRENVYLPHVYLSVCICVCTHALYVSICDMHVLCTHALAHSYACIHTHIHLLRSGSDHVQYPTCSLSVPRYGTLLRMHSYTHALTPQRFRSCSVPDMYTECTQVYGTFLHMLSCIHALTAQRFRSCLVTNMYTECTQVYGTLLHMHSYTHALTAQRFRSCSVTNMYCVPGHCARKSNLLIKI